MQKKGELELKILKTTINQFENVYEAFIRIENEAIAKVTIHEIPNFETDKPIINKALTILDENAYSEKRNQVNDMILEATYTIAQKKENDNKLHLLSIGEQLNRIDTYQKMKEEYLSSKKNV